MAEKPKDDKQPMFGMGVAPKASADAPMASNVKPLPDDSHEGTVDQDTGKDEQPAKEQPRCNQCSSFVAEDAMNCPKCGIVIREGKG